MYTVHVHFCFDACAFNSCSAGGPGGGAEGSPPGERGWGTEPTSLQVPFFHSNDPGSAAAVVQQLSS